MTTNDINVPLILAVAPNGARKTKADHPAVPIGPVELAAEAARCREVGAAMIHLHVRDADDKHSLDADAYAEATAAVRREVGDDMIIQMTTEAVGIYSSAQQIAAVRTVRPEAASLAVGEFCPDEAAVPAFAEFLTWMAAERIMPQYILYGPEDAAQFVDLRKRGVIPGDRPFLSCWGAIRRVRSRCRRICCRSWPRPKHWMPTGQSAPLGPANAAVP
jgi:uncharacterized protein (DUF849 family)